MSTERDGQPETHFALAEQAEPIRPRSAEGLSAETIKQELVQGIRQRYRTMLRRIRAAETVRAIEAETAASFTDRLKHLFIQERSESELDYVFGGRHPTVEEMRPAFAELKERAFDDFSIIHLKPPSNQQYWQLIDGKVNGLLRGKARSKGPRADLGSFPVIGGELVTHIATQTGVRVPIFRVDHIQVLDDQLYGTVRVGEGDGHQFDPGVYYPIVADRIVESIVGDAGEAVPIYGTPEFVIDSLTGEWSGAVCTNIEPLIVQPVVRGKLTDRIVPNEPTISKCSQVSINEQGRFSATILTDDGRWRLIVSEEVRESVAGRPIGQVGAFLVSETGKVSGTFQLGGEWVTVCEDEILEHLSGDHFPPSTYEFELIDGKLYGYIQTADDPFVPVIRNEPILELEGKKIIWVNNGEIYPDGTFDFGIVSVEEAGRQQPAIVLRSQLITEIDGKRIVSVADTLSFDGTLAGLSGLVQLEGEKKARRYVLGKWVKEQ